MPIEIHSYADCVEAFKTVRTPALGKPTGVGGIRLYRDNDESFRLVLKEREFARITKDDVITFVLSRDVLADTLASNLVYVMRRLLPIELYRVGMGRYRIGSPSSHKDIRFLPEYFGGIRFSLTDLVCLNRKPDQHENVNPDARKTWLRTLKSYRMGALARLKLGMRGSAKARTNIEISALADWMRKGEYPDALFNHLAYVAGNDEYTAHEKAFQNFMNYHSAALRKHFGVFND